MENEILSDINRRFDHAVLRSDATGKDIVFACNEAKKFDFFSVAINPAWVLLAKEELYNTGIKVLTVSGFPLGASRTNIKVEEAIHGVRDGAHEIDMVTNIGWLIEGRYKKVEEEIKTVRASLPFNMALKVIIEAGMLSPEQQAESTRAVVNGGAQFVKTCTGFFGGATVEQVLTLVKAAAGEVEVKASGGIRTLNQCRQFLEAGATRLGSSSSAAIMAELGGQL
ncbi:MAG: deoxyribose-phosphate aldolase [Candidatus Zixiibacteriota bacterium]|nr:MAG: deoxyribose-phosphate aldolase [candidate division Zixibacteria bacterium]